MKKRFFLSFFTLGIVSIIAQVLLLRELMVTFYGNELFLGLALGFWLLWTATGSFLGKRWLQQKAFLANLFFLAFILPFSLVLVRLLKTFFPIGVMIDFPKAIGLAFLSLAPLGLSLGFFFTTAFAFVETKKLALLASRAYLIETLGFVFGGLWLNFWLIQRSALLITFFLSFFVLTLAFFYSRRKLLLIIPFLVLITVILNSPLLDQKTTLFQFPHAIETRNSLYGRIIVTQKENQYQFFESGTLTGISQKIEDTEYLIHPVLLEHPQPRKVLMIGGGLNGALAEILKHQPEKVSYVEIDPVLVATVKKYLPPELAATLEDKRINLIFEDPRRFLKENQEKYDLVILNLPPPSTALINRLYTQEAMAEIKQTLNPDGILALNLSLPTDYISQESENLAGSIYHTLQQEFSQILLLPEYSLLYLASNQAVLTTNPQILSQRLEERQLETGFITPAYLENRLTDDRIKMFTQALKKEAKVNQDFFPIAYFYQTAFWQGYFSLKLAQFFSQLALIGLPLLGLLFFGLFIFLWKRPSALPIFLLALTGTTVMVWEIILIFAFQVKLGYIYHQISLLLAIILGGMTLGNYLANQSLTFKKHLKIILLTIILFTLVLPLILERASQPIIFLFLGGTAGLLTGTMFPLIMEGYLKKQGQVGIFYAADLVGSFLGAMLVSLFFIPVFGLQVTAYFLIIPFFFILLQKSGR